MSVVLYAKSEEERQIELYLVLLYKVEHKLDSIKLQMNKTEIGDMTYYDVYTSTQMKKQKLIEGLNQVTGGEIWNLGYLMEIGPHEYFKTCYMDTS